VPASSKRRNVDLVRFLIAQTLQGFLHACRAIKTRHRGVAYAPVHPSPPAFPSRFVRNRRKNPATRQMRATAGAASVAARALTLPRHHQSPAAL
jgi:hypothetical protein